MNSIGAPAKRRAIFSICAANYLARAAVLMDSVARHLPGHDRYLVLAADGVAPGDVAIYPAGTRLLTPADVAVPDLDLRRRLYNVTEFCTSIKPDMLGWLLDQGYDEVLYVDPDIVFFAPPDEIAAAFAAGADIVLTPHLVTASDHPQWALRAVSLSGQFNLGFIGLGAGAEARRALEWWRARIAMHCVEDAANGVFVDQKAVDFFASLFPGAHVIRHPGYNVAYWNLHERRLQQVGGGYRAAGQELAFFHFSGFALFGDGVSRHVPADAPPAGAVEAILRAYGRAIVAKGELDRFPVPYAYNRLPDGTRSSELVRRSMRGAIEEVDSGIRARDLLRPGFLTEPVWRLLDTHYGAPVARLVAMIDQFGRADEALRDTLDAYLDSDRASRRRETGTLLAALHEAGAIDVRTAERIAEWHLPETLRRLMGRRDVDLFGNAVRLQVEDRRGGVELPVFLVVLHYTRQDLRESFDLSTVAGIIVYVAWFLTIGLGSWVLSDEAIDTIAAELDRVSLAPAGDGTGASETIASGARGMADAEATLLDSAVLHIFEPQKDEHGEPRPPLVASPAIALEAVLGTGRRPPLKPRVARVLRAWIWGSGAGARPARILRILSRSARARQLLLGARGARRVTVAAIDEALRRVGLGELAMHAPSAQPAAGLPADGQTSAGRPAEPVDVLIVGPFESNSGVGQSARGVRARLEAEGRRVHSLDLLARSAKGRQALPDLAPRLLVLHANADVTLESSIKFNPVWHRAERRIGYWYWELEAMTERMASSALVLDEIWVATRFVHDAVVPAVPIPVRVRPPLIDPAGFQPSSPGGGSFGAGKRGYRFLGVLDARSFVERKNPLGIVRAFRRAFADLDAPVELIVKLSNAHHNEPGLSRFRDLAAGDRRIRIVEGTLSDLEMNDLYESADCFVSLHRSEGLGLGILQAMMRGKAVIATAYSGPMDFMHAGNAFLVPYQLVPVAADAYPDWLCQRWADPDEAAAAVYMKELAKSPAAGVALGRRAREDAKRLFAPAPKVQAAGVSGRSSAIA
ncbi:hypothetical protein STVA_36180 [Allostella vacuolata]|nr:hypothetical protein STVA_36180 [Stella vacuolata]